MDDEWGGRSLSALAQRASVTRAVLYEWAERHRWRERRRARDDEPDREWLATLPAQRADFARRQLEAARLMLAVSARAMTAHPEWATTKRDQQMQRKIAEAISGYPEWANEQATD